jgi:hypothetical protein
MYTNGSMVPACAANNWPEIEAGAARKNSAGTNAVQPRNPPSR